MSVQTASRGSGMALHGIPLVRQVQLDPLELQVHLDPPELLVIPAHLAHLAHLDPPVIPAHLAHLDLPEHQEFLAPLDLREHPVWADPQVRAEALALLEHREFLAPLDLPEHLDHLERQVTRGLPEHQEFLAPLDLREHPGSRVQPELLVLQVPVSIIFRTPHQLLHTQTAIGGMTPQPDWNLFGLLLA